MRTGCEEGTLTRKPPVPAFLLSVRPRLMLLLISVTLGMVTAAAEGGESAVTLCFCNRRSSAARQPGAHTLLCRTELSAPQCHLRDQCGCEGLGGRSSAPGAAEGAVGGLEAANLRGRPMEQLRAALATQSTAEAAWGLLCGSSLLFPRPRTPHLTLPLHQKENILEHHEE